jgi:hypothetical protein
MGTVGQILIVLAAAGAVGPAPSAPPTALDDQAIAAEHSLVERIAYHRCWRRNGERRCRWVASRKARVHRYRNGSHGPETNLPPNLGWGL